MRKSNEVPFEKVLEEEQKTIKALRRNRFGPTPPALKSGASERAESALNPIGLAFSGGGIRSATFNLGVLQGLADLGLLSTFDYLSTVSGGGYIGGWLVAWMRRKNPSFVYERLRTDSVDRRDEGEPREIQFLREYSNYLTPKLGLFTGDTWAFIGAYVRNLLLNQIILGLVLISLLFLSRPLVLEFWRIANPKGSESWTVPLVASVLLCVSLGATISNLSDITRTSRSSSADRLFAAPGLVDLFVLLPTAGAIWLLWAWWWRIHLPWICEENSTGKTSLYAGVGYAALWFVGWMGGAIVKKLVRRFKPPPSFKVMSQSAVVGPPGASKSFYNLVAATAQAAREHGLDIFSIILWAGVAGSVGGFLIVELTKLLDSWVPPYSQTPEWHIASWGFPLAVLVFLFVQTLHIGLVSDGFTEDVLEWWGRSGGMLARLTLGLSALYAVSLDGPRLLELLKNHGFYKWALAAVWAAITGAGVQAGKNPAKRAGGLKLSPSLIAKIAPPVFVLGLLLILSAWTGTILHALNNWLFTSPLRGVALVERWLGMWPGTVNAYLPSYWDRVEGDFHGFVWIYILVFFLIAWLLSSRVGINRFSMHSVYQNRLVRCYLGASNDDHQPQPFTGFDPGDDSVCLKDIDPATGYAGPYPIMNTTLNLVSSKNLAWQQRKAASFVFTPMYSGFEVPSPDGQTLQAFQRTEKYQVPITLGMAMATSGAAASPNMGFHSSPALAFLMTIFNVRLGRWIGNPRYSSTGGRMDPRLGLLYLFIELLGQTNDESSYVYISDGGHFENLGVYELVRRRCRFVVACDAGEDHALKFGDLGNAIEKCRTDLGVDIEIDIEPIRLRKDVGKSRWHCAVGTIHYENVDPSLTSGTIVYLKSSLTGDEPTDVQRYADQNPAFPHQTTADQWFNESQFESYRALGWHVVQSAFGVVGNRKELSQMDVEQMFVKLRQRWYPPSSFIQASFTKHTATYTSLLEKMRTNEKLDFLDAQVFPQWSALTAVKSGRHPDSLWIPEDVDKRRQGFYFCNRVIQLMEDAYLDLNLETEFDHPDNRGWVNLFRHWSWSGMFCATWAISASIYGARFQSFCERRLDLRPGRVRIRRPPEPSIKAGDPDPQADFWENLTNAKGLDFWEVELLQTFLKQGRPQVGDLMQDRVALSRLQVVPFEIVVESLHSDPNKGSDDNKRLKFNIGFALVLVSEGDSPVANIWYFRIQDHVRKMGLAREALRQLLTEFGQRVQNDVHIAPAIDPSKLPGGASKLEALPTAETVQKFKAIFDSVKFHGERQIGG